MTRAANNGRSKTGFTVNPKRCSVPIIQRVAVVLLFLSQFAHAKIQGFVQSADAITCGYPFAEFQLEEISCYYSLSWYSFDAFWNNREEDVCYWGQKILLKGTVTVSEGVYRYFETDVKVCFSDTYCKKSTTKIDLFSYVVDEEGNDWKNRNPYATYRSYYDYNGDEEEEQQNHNSQFYKMNYQDFLSAGEYEFEIPLKLSELTFVKSSDEYEGMTATIVMYPKQRYYYNDEEDNYWHTDCMASFELYDEEASEYQYRYAAAAAIACAGVLGVLFAKRRRLTCLCVESVDEDEEEDANEVVSSDFEKM